MNTSILNDSVLNVSVGDIKNTSVNSIVDAFVKVSSYISVQIQELIKGQALNNPGILATLLTLFIGILLFYIGLKVVQKVIKFSLYILSILIIVGTFIGIAGGII